MMPFPTTCPRRSRALNSADRANLALAQLFAPAEDVKSAPHLWRKELKPAFEEIKITVGDYIPYQEFAGFRRRERDRMDFYDNDKISQKSL
jgi:hypothetical protein